MDSNCCRHDSDAALSVPLRLYRGLCSALTVLSSSFWDAVDKSYNHGNCVSRPWLSARVFVSLSFVSCGSGRDLPSSPPTGAAVPAGWLTHLFWYARLGLFWSVLGTDSLCWIVDCATVSVTGSLPTPIISAALKCYPNLCFPCAHILWKKSKQFSHDRESETSNLLLDLDPNWTCVL